MNNDISIYEARSVHRREMQINVLCPTTVRAFSIQRIMYDACRYRLQLRYIENIPVAGLSCTLRSLLPLAHQSYAHQFAFPFADSVTLSNRASASSAGPMIIVDQAESHLAPLETFWPQADCSIGLLNATSWLLIVHTCIMHACCILHVCECICMLIRDGRVGLASDIFKYICLLYYFMLFSISLYLDFYLLTLSRFTSKIYSNIFSILLFFTMHLELFYGESMPHVNYFIYWYDKIFYTIKIISILFALLK